MQVVGVVLCRGFFYLGMQVLAKHVCRTFALHTRVAGHVNIVTLKSHQRNANEIDDRKVSVVFRFQLDGCGHVSCIGNPKSLKCH